MAIRNSIRDDGSKQHYNSGNKIITSNADNCNLRNTQGWNTYHYSYLTLLWDRTTRYQAVLGHLPALQSD